MKRGVFIFFGLCLMTACSSGTLLAKEETAYFSYAGDRADKADLTEREQLDKKEAEEVKEFTAFKVEHYDHSNISFDLKHNNESEHLYIKTDEVFPEDYTNVEGVLTFRGGPMRDQPAYGQLDTGVFGIEESWQYRTGFNSDWGGGAGWTGQPALVKWEKDVREMMNIYSPFINDEDFVEVIQGSLDGNVYFLDLETGKETRHPIEVGNPIKGSVSADSRGYPLLYVGDGVPYEDSFGLSIYSLIDGSLLHHISGRDGFAFREWGAFDSSALVNRKTDTLVVGGENGIFYKVKLNTLFDKDAGTVSVAPDELKLRYEVEGNDYQGIENSVAVYKNLAFFADNGGSIMAVNLQTMSPVWALPPLDDTDSTIVVEVVDDVPYLYTGTEVDNIGRDGDCHLRKINGMTGEVVWQKSYSAFYYPGVAGGVLATPVLGKQAIEDVVIFTIARHGGRYRGLMAALDKETGEEVWTRDMPFYAWSSPVDVYDKKGNAYLIQGDFNGDVTLLNGENGQMIDQVSLGVNIEASPAVYNNTVVLASRSGYIHGITIE
ncbi:MULTISPECIES: PQQ-binding-like beta-propeller repeat protein [Alteribacter]|uniref:Pyrrolo-quinoline quinone n=1 Tax=Alteribacter keqinensis TaxID=2483800 RepID=A0A3M7TYH0_9BACI|nr:MULTISPECIES: PQQ-binding-like beta-propeller repeat protein [Alteribacter]MBM7094300.1 PQQ-binding-like beta-propeller repeat protein [Alteribacter salitolerans]RNA69465.1 pyrrolo-quinoline quinone [Alteribacter keqinensis]